MDVPKILYCWKVTAESNIKLENILEKVKIELKLQVSCKIWSPHKKIQLLSGHRIIYIFWNFCLEKLNIEALFSLAIKFCIYEFLKKFWGC